MIVVFTMSPRSYGAVAISAAALLLGGCVSDLDVTSSEQTLWEAEFVGGPEALGVSGRAAVVSGSELMEAGVSIQGLAVGRYTWSVRQGRCASPGDPIGGEGQYPEVVVDEPDGEGDDDPGPVEAETQPFRGTMRSDGAYHAEVRDEGSDERVVCGDFIRA